MPIALFAALAGSVAIHLATMFGTDFELFGSAPEPLVLQAELQLPPAPLAEPVKVPTLTSSKVAKPVKPDSSVKPKHKTPQLVSAVAVEPAAVALAENDQNTSSTAPESESPLGATNVQPPATPVLPASGTIRFAIYKESLGLQVGRAEHRWEFRADGSYRLSGITETSGLAALLKPVRLEVISTGRMVAGGLQPDTFRSLKNGQDANENADFSWSTVAVTLSRDGSVRPIAAGTQDILSLNYQLAYLGKLAEGASLGVVTGKKYERYAIDSLGEEEIDTPAGHFRTLHLRVMTDNVTEFWIALDQTRLPVKIRFTDKKGESFEQVATEIGMP